jgi:hypothetical protein
LKKQVFILLFISCFIFVSAFAIGSELTIEELSIVEKLFKINNLKHDENIKVVRVQETKLGATVITCDQFYKGLLHFNGQFNYTFRPDGTSRRQSYLAEILIKHQEVDINIDPIISKDEVSQLFVENFRSYEWPIKSKETEKMLLELDTYSLHIVLGIFDKRRGIPPANYILAWKVRLDDREYPYAIFDANNGSFLEDDCGIDCGKRYSNLINR